MQVAALVRDIDTASPALAGRIEHMTGEARELVDYAFERVLWAILAVLLAAIVYRAVAARITRTNASGTR